MFHVGGAASQRTVIEHTAKVCSVGNHVFGVLTLWPKRTIKKEKVH